MERSEEEAADLGHISIEAGRNADLTLHAEIGRAEEEKTEVEPPLPDPFETDSEIEVDLDDEVLLPRQSSKPRPPPVSGELTRQGNIEPTPGAYRVSPGRTVTRASATASSETSVATTPGDDAPVPPPPPLPALVEADPVVSSVLVEATAIDGEVIPEVPSVRAEPLVLPPPPRTQPSRKRLVLLLSLAAVSLLAIIVGLVVWSTTRGASATSQQSVWPDDVDGRCSVQKALFNECVGFTGSGVSDCERCIEVGWPQNPISCHEIDLETCRGLNSSQCSVNCVGCEKDFIDYFECRSQCSLAAIDPCPGSNSGSGSPSNAPLAAPSFAPTVGNGIDGSPPPARSLILLDDTPSISPAPTEYYAPSALPSISVVNSYPASDPDGRESEALYSVARTDRSGPTWAIRDMVLALAYAYSLNTTYGGACFRKPVAVELQVNREALIQVLGLEDVLMFGCPDSQRSGGEFISAKNYMKTGKSLITASFVEWLRARSRAKLSSAVSAEAVVHIQRGDVNPCGRWKDRYLPSTYYREVVDQYLPFNASVAIFSELDSFEPWSEFRSAKYSLRLDANVSEAWIAAATAQYVVLSLSSYAYLPALLNANGTIVYAPTWQFIPMPHWIPVRDSFLARGRSVVKTLLAQQCKERGLPLQAEVKRLRVGTGNEEQ